MQLMLRLVLTILLPVVVGKAVQALPGVAAWAKEQATALKLVSSFMVVLIPWVKVSQATEALSRVQPLQLVYVALLGAAFHVTLLLLNAAASHALLPGVAAEKKAVVLCASQTALGASIAVVDTLGQSSAGPPGLLILPAILTYFVQIFTDAYLAVRLAGVGTWDGWCGSKVPGCSQPDDDKVPMNREAGRPSNAGPGQPSSRTMASERPTTAPEEGQERCPAGDVELI